jgi:sulfur carrier protein
MTAGALNVVVNGRPDRLPAGQTVADLVCAATGSAAPRGVAVALNGTVVRRDDWPRTALSEGDSVEVLTATQGG